jgi:hypothetical protein
MRSFVVTCFRLAHAAPQSSPVELSYFRVVYKDETRGFFVEHVGTVYAAAQRKAHSHRRRATNGSTVLSLETFTLNISLSPSVARHQSQTPHSAAPAVSRCRLFTSHRPRPRPRYHLRMQTPRRCSSARRRRCAARATSGPRRRKQSEMLFAHVQHVHCLLECVRGL